MEQSAITCSRARELFFRSLHGGPVLPEDARKHMEICSSCRPSFAVLAHSAADANLPPDLIRRIQAGLIHDLRPVSPIASTAILVLRILGVLGIFVCAATLVIGGSGFRIMASSQTTVTSLVCLIFAVLFAFSITSEIVPGTRRPFLPSILTGASVIVFLLSVAILFPWDARGSALSGGWQCWRTGVLLASIAAVLVGLLIQRGTAQRLPELGVLIGGLSGLTAVAVMQLNCSRQLASHLVLYHAGVLMATAAAGFLIGRVYHQRKRIAV